jgi:aminomethyltransferase
MPLIMENTILKQTPLIGCHKNLNAKLAPFESWLMPIQYEGIIAEHNWTRESGSLFDVCHMGEFLIRADPDKLGGEKVFTFRLPSMPVASCKYGFILNEKGGIVDDIIAYRLDEDRWMIVVNAATKDKDLIWINSRLPECAITQDISEKTAKLDLQGPASFDILKPMAGEDMPAIKYYQFGTFRILGYESIISRTGYTGELGFEIYIDISHAADIWNRILEDRRVKPAGLGARDTLRLEMGYPLYGQDINDNTTPLEAGLDSFVDFSKDFTGKDALLEQRKEGLNKKFISLISNTRKSPRRGDKIYSEQKHVGDITSGSFSPGLGFGIGMGYIENGYDWVGADILLKNENGELAAKITEKPFYKKGTART